MTPVYGTCVQNYYLNLVRKNFQARKKRLQSIRTRKDAEIYREEVREKIKKLFPLPLEKTPLNPIETGILKYSSYQIHKIIYYSRPNYPVTANLYLPDAETKVPAVLFLCGHSEEGKACATYQTAARALAMRGYAVLAVDPVSQGERLQFLNVPGFSEHCCGEHNIMGKQLLLTGDSIGAWRAWDAIRGLDYLLSRPEVDPARVGITGNSGGGTMTTFVNALEDRFTMAAPSCYITTWLHNVENELPADAEQMPPGTLEAGLEMGDFLIARAPRPLAVLGMSNDFFDPRGTKETYEEVRNFYALLDAGNKIRLTIGIGGHGFSQTNREAMYSLFHTVAGVDAPGKEPEDIVLCPPEELACVSGGQVENLPGNKHLREFTIEKADRLAFCRSKYSLEELQTLMKRVLKLEIPEIPHYRVLRFHQSSSCCFSRFGLETEPEQLMSVLKLKDQEIHYHLPKTEKIILYIPHLDSEDEMVNQAFPADCKIYGLDLRGIGECMPSGCDQPPVRNFFVQYEFDYHYASLANMFGTPYLSGKVKDILGAVELLAQDGAAIQVNAKGQGTIPALIAALLSDKITALHLEDGPESWQAMVHTANLTQWPLSCMIPGILRETDLPDLRNAIAEKLV